MHDDARIEAGMVDQLARRDAAVADGDRAIGWKLGLGTAAMRERFGTSGPLVGFLSESGVIADGATVPFADSIHVEAEIAVELARPIAAGTSPSDVRRAIGRLLPAIEVVALGAFDDVTRILAGNIFHLGVVLGGPGADASAIDAPGRARVFRNGLAIADLDDPYAAPGRADDLLAYTADYLGRSNLSLAAGEIVITGAIVPPIEVAAGDRFEVDYAELGSVSVAFA